MTDLTPATASTGRERRRHYRAAVLPVSTLQVRAWRLEPGVPLARRPMPSQILALGIRQVGAGGLTVEVPAAGADDDAPARPVRETDRIRVEVTYADKTALVEARLRAAPDPAVPRTGLVFQGRDTDPAYREARSALTAIVAAVQREELRHRDRSQSAAA